MNIKNNDGFTPDHITVNCQRSNRDEKWLANYEALKTYIDEHHHLPDKHKETDRNKLSWWKYQMKKKKAGTLTEEQIVMLQTLADSRSKEHTGGEDDDDNPAFL